MKQLYELSRTRLVASRTTEVDVQLALRPPAVAWDMLLMVDVVGPGSDSPGNYTFNTATKRNTSETYAHSLPVVTAEASAVGAEAGIVVGEAGIYVVSECYLSYTRNAMAEQQ